MASIEDMVRHAVQRFDALSPEEKHAHRAAQRRSWVCGELMLLYPEISRSEADRLCDEAGL